MKKIKKDAIVCRLYARGTWKLDSAAHFGSGETGIADMCLLKDKIGKPIISGTSIAGAARSFLARQRKPLVKYQKGNEDKALKRFFGGDMRQNRSQSKKNKDTMSALIVADSTCISECPKISIRDGVRVGHESGSAVKGAKFDVEVVERGTEFEFLFECIIRNGENQKDMEDIFLVLLHAFQQGDIRLGARTRRGYGRGKVESWEIRDLRMSNPADVMAWILDDPWSRPESLLKKKLKNYSPPSDHRQYFRIEADFDLRTSLLIRSSSGDPEAPDMVHLQSDGEPVVPGTSFAGAFRHRATLIANTIRWDDDAVDKMFGYVYEDKGNRRQKADARASRVWIEEQLVKNVRYQWQDRVAIDRFTGGSLDGALFNEKPVYPLSLDEIAKKESSSNLRLILALEEPKEAEIGLLLLTLRDFWYGNTALGGETSNGRGTLQGIKAKLIYKNTPDPNDRKEWKLKSEDKHITLEKDDDGFLQCCVDAAQNYTDRPKASRRPKEDVKEDSDVE